MDNEEFYISKGMNFMPFNNNYNGFANNNAGQNGNQNGGFGANTTPDKHYKFPKIYGDDSYISAELWVSSMGGPKAIIRVYTGVPNPGTGKMTFEEGKPSTLPSVYLGLDEVASLLSLKNVAPETLNVSHKKGTRTIAITGSPAGVKVTITEEGKGNPRTITFRQYFGWNGGWNAFCDIIQKIYDKMIVSRVPDDFGNAMGESAPTSEAISSDSPF